MKTQKLADFAAISARRAPSASSMPRMSTPGSETVRAPRDFAARISAVASAPARVTMMLAPASDDMWWRFDSGIGGFNTVTYRSYAA